ncbi:MAG: hypothetical protein OXB86_05130 [Bdellovibrionales bacterium]|nr:hypothetical protein [Bdellovibrionales bacterium]
MKSALTGIIIPLFLLSCGGNNNDTELRNEVCSQFNQYKRCTKQLTTDKFFECEKKYDLKMKALRVKYGNATISTIKGFNYRDVRRSLDNCVDKVESDKPLEQWKQCLIRFQDSVLKGFQCS